MKQYVLKTPNSERAEQATVTKGQKAKIAKQIVLGIDAHLHSYQVGRKLDGGGIQPVQSFKPEKFLGFVAIELRCMFRLTEVFGLGQVS